MTAERNNATEQIKKAFAWALICDINGTKISVAFSSPTGMDIQREKNKKRSYHPLYL